MKRKITAVLVALLAAAMLLGGCHVNINFTDSGSRTEQSTQKTESELAGEIASVLDNLTSAEEQLNGTAGYYTMADISSLKNTQNFAKNTLNHIFDGTINGKGNATGYHYSRVTDSKGEIIEGTESAPDRHGVFTAKVKVDGKKKNGFSSFYPESWSPQQVVDAINEAYDDAMSDKSNPHGELWIGYSGDLEIDMYLNNSKKITTAYPVYEGA